MLSDRLAALSASLGGKEYLEGRFTAGDIVMTTVLRELVDCDALSQFPNLDAYRRRREARPAFGRTLEARCRCFAKTRRRRASSGKACRGGLRFSVRKCDRAKMLTRLRLRPTRRMAGLRRSLSQGKSGLADRDHHQQRLRLRQRQASAQSAKLREIGFAANRRLLEVERLSHDCMLAEDTFQAINCLVAAGRQHASGLRFAGTRVHALWHAVILFRQLADGVRAADLRHHLAAPSGRDPEAISQGASPISCAVRVRTA
jgi:hypothetical protein